MAALPVQQDYAEVLLSDTPLLDLRAPVEFAKGAFPAASNVPLLSDAERAAIGTCYKHEGHHAAVTLGATLISGDVKQARLDAWSAYLARHPDASLYCFRGGMRSRLTQEWIAEALGQAVPRIAGGYKAMRRFLIDATERLAAHNIQDVAKRQFIRLGGRTGAGKTGLLNSLPGAVDLEGLARHKGSAFGGEVEPQPTQISFENALAIQLLRLESSQYTRWVFEDEGRNIGSVHIPLPLMSALQRSPIVLLERPLAARIQISLDAYVNTKLAQLRLSSGEQGAVKVLRMHIEESLQKIQRRLGAARYIKAQSLMHKAFQRLEKGGETDGFEALIALLLTEYYDPMYDYQLSKKDELVVFSGDVAAVRQYLTETAIQGR